MKTKALYVLATSIIGFLLLSVPAWTQTPVVQKDSLYSKYLLEHRHVEIIFPKSYKERSAETYDVLYVLDGEWNTSLAVTVYGFLEYAKFIPANIIIVSVPNYYKDGINRRDRDFTPTSIQVSEEKSASAKSGSVS